MVKNMARRSSTVSSKHQITIPADAFRGAGLQVGDKLEAHADGPGRVVLERAHDPVADYAGALTGAWDDDSLDRLRAEWR